MRMPDHRSSHRAVLVLFIAGILGCEAKNQDAAQEDNPDGATVTANTSDGAATLAASPPGKLVCDALGSDSVESKSIGEPEDSIVHPKSARVVKAVYAHHSGASNKLFTVKENRRNFPHVDVSVPPGRATGITLGYGGCDLGGDTVVILYRHLGGTQWKELARKSASAADSTLATTVVDPVPPDSSAIIPSGVPFGPNTTFALGTAN